MNRIKILERLERLLSKPDSTVGIDDFLDILVLLGYEINGRNYRGRAVTSASAAEKRYKITVGDGSQWVATFNAGGRLFGKHKREHELVVMQIIARG